mmetsp:Transcript_6750/g.20446  ORF Transcript_6750/g.20446 Transcript_6750/m.20446 type:complete len:109 (-) Transcript_6750:696-1022(-)
MGSGVVASGSSECDETSLWAVASTGAPPTAVLALGAPAPAGFAGAVAPCSSGREPAVHSAAGREESADDAARSAALEADAQLARTATGAYLALSAVETAAAAPVVATA